MMMIIRRATPGMGMRHFIYDAIASLRAAFIYFI